MSWFKRDKNKALIPPVEAPSSINRAPSSASSTAPPPSYRSSANTFVASRDGDLSDPNAYGNQYRSNSGGQSANGGHSSGGYGDMNRPNYGNTRQYSDQGYGSGDGYAQRDRYSNKNEYGSSSVVSDPYMRGERNIDADRNALFAGSASPGEGRANNFTDGPAGRPPPPPGEEQEEDVEETIKQTRFMKQDTVQSTRNALRIAREAEEVGRATLLRLGEQSGEFHTGNSFHSYLLIDSVPFFQKRLQTLSATLTFQRVMLFERRTTLTRSRSLIGPYSSRPSHLTRMRSVSHRNANARCGTGRKLMNVN